MPQGKGEIPFLRATSAAPKLEGPTAADLASSKEGAAFDALLYAQFQLWHNYLLEVAQVPLAALQPRYGLVARPQSPAWRARFRLFAASVR